LIMSCFFCILHSSSLFVQIYESNDVNVFSIGPSRDDHLLFEILKLCENLILKNTLILLFDKDGMLNIVINYINNNNNNNNKSYLGCVGSFNCYKVRRR
jgi:hypothetical protein